MCEHDQESDYMEACDREEIIEERIGEATKPLREALEHIIKLNRQTAKDKYGNQEIAESWACIKIARKALERK